MKKLLILVLMLTIALSAVLSLSACESNAETSNQSVSSSISVAETNSIPESNSASSAAESVNPKKSYASMPQYSIPRVNSTTASLAATKVYLVGDSTVCNYTETGEFGRFYMRNGYGMRLGEYLYNEAEIVNLAISGRSSKSFITENNYKTLTNSIKAGDYLIIGFGHNDEKFEVARYTNPVASTTDPTSFKYYLYEKYIKIAIDAGATPILCTPIVRRTATGVYSGTNVHITASTATYVGGDYVQAIKELGAEKNVLVIDLTTTTKNFFTGLTEEQSAMYYSWTTSNSTTFDKTSTSVDNTHINAYGAQVVAKMLAEQIKLTDCALKNYVVATMPTPTTDALVPLASR